jgi:hypothetical protein
VVYAYADRHEVTLARATERALVALMACGDGFAGFQATLPCRHDIMSGAAGPLREQGQSESADSLARV